MNFINKWKDKITQYAEVRLRLIQINFIKRTSTILSHMMFTMIALLIFFAILIFLGFGLAEWYTVLANGSRVLGFFMAIGTYVVLLLIAFALRKPIIKVFTGLFIRILTENDEEDENEKKQS
ncbi:MAG TPA: hypothetical protein VN721_15315 [Flavipsychrobacter sp.]|nr:hypothetical protein [Flavipsychrobacter sp.]